MCGILAVFGLRGGPDGYRNDVLRLSKLMRHRGPDWNGINCYGNCILAHERLAIVGLHSGAQPITTKTNDSALSVNGEIYNHEELEKELKAERPEVAKQWSTDSDCEVLLHLFKAYGSSFLETKDVNGMYAFAAYNQTTDEYMVARDPIGIIPLYMGWGSDGTVWFSSEMKSLQSVCDHVELFPPGHYYTASAGGTDKGVMKSFYKERWLAEPNCMPDPKSDVSLLRQELTDSVKRHIMSEVPYGLLLSGGLDSSLIAAIACREYKKLGNADVLRSFCIGLEGSPDIASAELVAAHIGSRHYSFTFTVQQGLDALADVIYHLETFDLTTVRASVPMFLLARRLKATGCKMVLSGEGADEIFGGYLYFHKAPNVTEMQKELVAKVGY
jgi:asparagine synthase (glutamine-hydrolysing)